MIVRSYSPPMLVRIGTMGLQQEPFIGRGVTAPYYFPEKTKFSGNDLKHKSMSSTLKVNQGSSSLEIHIAVIADYIL